MEDKGKKCVLGLPPFLNRPPVSPKPFTITPMPTTFPVVSGSGWPQKQPYSTNHGEATSSQTKSHLKSFKGKAPIPPPPRRINPIKSITPSIDNHGGITVKTELGINYEMKLGRVDPSMEDRKIRRILSNRISARKSRKRKVNYLNDMERKKKNLEIKIAMFAPLIESEQEKNKQLQMENHFLKERIRSCEALAKLSIAMVEENRAIIRALKGVLYAGQQYFYMQLQEEPSMLVGGNTDEQMMVMEDSSSRSDEPKPMAEDEDLNFTSFIIDPPNNLHYEKL